jgi:hypothetical protein
MPRPPHPSQCYYSSYTYRIVQLIKLYVMKAYGEGDVQIYIILTLVLVGGK